MINNDLKKEFQVERIAFFSDAVFAIAITLLIIEIKVPEIHGAHIDSHALWMGLARLIPKFIGFIVSFFVIALYWVNHHLIFKYVEHYSPKLIWNNIFLLCSIVIMPFSSAFYSEYWPYFAKVSFGFYVINICATGFMNYRLWGIISAPGSHLSKGLENPALVKYYRTRALITPCIFMTAFIVGFFSLMVSYVMPLLIPVVMTIVVRRYKKHYPELFVKKSEV